MDTRSALSGVIADMEPLMSAEKTYMLDNDDRFWTLSPDGIR